MFRQIGAFFRRLFANRGFRRGLRIFFWLLLAWYLYNIYKYLVALMHTGLPLGKALRILFRTPLSGSVIPLPFASVALGVVIGVVWFYRRKKQKQQAQEKKAGETPAPKQEAEIIETTHYKFY